MAVDWRMSRGFETDWRVRRLAGIGRASPGLVVPLVTSVKGVESEVRQSGAVMICHVPSVLWQH